MTEIAAGGQEQSQPPDHGFSLPEPWLLDTLYNHDRNQPSSWAARLYQIDGDYVYSGFGFGQSPQAAIDAAVRTSPIATTWIEPTFVDIRGLFRQPAVVIERKF